jgi:hypothetical protein
MQDVRKDGKAINQDEDGRDNQLHVCFILCMYAFDCVPLCAAHRCLSLFHPARFSSSEH